MRKFIAKLAVLLAALLPVAAQAEESVTFTLGTSSYYVDGAFVGGNPYFVDGTRGDFKVFKGGTTSSQYTINSNIPDGYYASQWVLSTQIGGTGTEVQRWGAANSVTVYFDYDWAGKYGKYLELTVSIDQMSYSVTYQPNSGSWVVEPQKKGPWKYSLGGTLPTADDITREGYTLTGWKVGSSSTILAPGTSFTGSTLGIQENGEKVTLTAQWAAKTYKVTCEPGQYGIGSVMELTKTNGVALKLPGAIFTRDHYTQDGWSRSDGGSKDFNLNAGYSDNADAMLYPYWNATTYTITLSNDGNGTATAFPSGSSQLSGTEIIITAKPNTGYAFEKWISTVAPATIYENPHTFKITANVQFQACFTNKICIVTFDAQGGTCSETSRSVKYGNVIGALPTPTYGARAFKGWFDDQVAGSQITQNTLVKNNMTVYAHWGEAQQYTITAKANPVEGGGVTGGGKKYDAGTPATLTATNNPGYSFVDWAHGEKSPTFTTNVVADAEYTANFEANKYKVYFDPNGGSVTVTKKTVTYDQPYGELPVPTPKEGSKDLFLGWFDDDGTKEKVSAETIVKITDNQDLYAHWGQLPTVRNYVDFDGNGATSGEMAQQTFTNGIAQALSANQFVKAGHMFQGWTNELKQVGYADEEVVTFYDPDNTTNTLKAVWAANTYTMRFAPNAATVLNPTAQGDISNCVSGAGVQLPPCQYVNLPSCGFDGWVNGLNVTNKAGKVVTNYVEHAGDLVTYKAAWLGNSDLSAAVGLEVTALTNRQDNTLRWTSDGTCVGIKPEKGSKAEANRMAMLVKGPGSVVFHCKKGSEALDTDYLYLYAGYERPLITKLHDYLLDVTSDYQPYAIAITNGGIQAVTWDYTTSGHEEACLNDVFYVDDVRWIPDVTTYAVAFDPNGGSGSMEAQVMTVGVETALVSNAFTRADHNFLGWATNATGKVIYTDGAKVKNLAAPGETATLYAVWERMDVGELSRAVGLNNAVLTTTGVKWTVATEEYRTGPECITCAPNNATTSKLFMAVEGPGIVQYYVKGAKNFKSTFNVYTNGVQYGAVSFTSAYPDKPLEISVAAGVTNVEWRFSGQGTGNKAYMDDVRWTPKGGKPKPLILFIK